MWGVLPILALLHVIGAPMLPSATEGPCAVAVSYVEQWLATMPGRAVVFDTAPQMVDSVGRVRWPVVKGKPGTKPSRALMARLEATQGVNAVTACPTLRAYLDRAGIGYGDDAVRAVLPPPGVAGNYRKAILSVALPAVGADKRTAVLAASTSSFPMGGGGFLHFLRRRSDGSWHLVSTAGLWIS